MKRYQRSRRMIGLYSKRSGKSLRTLPTEKARASLQRVVDMLQVLAIEQPSRILALEEIIRGMLGATDREGDPGNGNET